jgi:hypothetical protein
LPSAEIPLQVREQTSLQLAHSFVTAALLSPDQPSAGFPDHRDRQRNFSHRDTCGKPCNPCWNEVFDFLSDSLSVDGLAQDIAETFTMYQRYMSGLLM